MEMWTSYKGKCVILYIFIYLFIYYQKHVHFIECRCRKVCEDKGLTQDSALGQGEEWKVEYMGYRSWAELLASMMPPDLLIDLEDQHWDDDEQNGHEDAQNQGPDVQALGGGGIGLGASQVANHLPVPRLHGVSECYEAQAAGVHKESVEQGPDNMVGHRGLFADVDHGGRRRSRVVGRPQHSHLVLVLEHLIVGGLAAVDRREEGWTVWSMAVQ